MVETKVKAYNAVSTATREGAEPGGPDESHKLSVSDLSINSPQKAVFTSWLFIFAINTGTSGFAQQKGVA